MPLYKISLPPRIPDDFFSLLAGNVNDGIIRGLREEYRRIEKEAFLYASSPRKAISQYFFREVQKKSTANKEIRRIRARSLAKIFLPNVDEYVFIPKEKKKTASQNLEQALKESHQLELGFWNCFSFTVYQKKLELKRVTLNL